jgi:hypothetical protein
VFFFSSVFTLSFRGLCLLNLAMFYYSEDIITFQDSGAWPDPLSNRYSERVPRVISEAGRSGLDFLILGPGQILYQIATQNVFPG